MYLECLGSLSCRRNYGPSLEHLTELSPRSGGVAVKFSLVDGSQLSPSSVRQVSFFFLC